MRRPAHPFWRENSKTEPKVGSWQHAQPSTPINPGCVGVQGLTLLWMTTTLWLSALSQVSMALQMLQILSRAGAWWSGQPKSNTWETKEQSHWRSGRAEAEERVKGPQALPLDWVGWCHDVSHWGWRAKKGHKQNVGMLSDGNKVLTRSGGFDNRSCNYLLADKVSIWPQSLVTLAQGVERAVQ